MNRTTARERRLIALLILVSGVALVWLAIVAPIINGFHDRADRHKILLAQYTANQRLIAAVPRMRRQAERQRDMLRVYQSSEIDRVAAGEALIERVQDAIEAASGEVRSSAEIDGEPGSVRVRAGARMTVAQMISMLQTLQNVSPVLGIDALSVAADEALVSGRLEPVDVNFEVSLALRLASS